MAAISIRNLDDEAKHRLHVRAARHGRSMEAEARAILEEAVTESEPAENMFAALMDRVGALGGIELDIPPRNSVARAADLEQ